MLSRACDLLIAVEEQLESNKGWQMRPLSVADLDQHINNKWLEVVAKSWSAKEAAAAANPKSKPKKMETGKLKRGNRMARSPIMEAEELSNDATTTDEP